MTRYSRGVSLQAYLDTIKAKTGKTPGQLKIWAVCKGNGWVKPAK